MPSLTYLDCVAVALRWQQLACVSPYRRLHDTLATSKALTMYSCTFIGFYVLFVAVVILDVKANVGQVALQKILSYGYLAIVITVAEVTYTLFTYPWFLVFTQFTRQLQMSTLKRIVDLDALLIGEFQLDLQPYYRRLIQKQRVELAAGLVYFSIMFGFLLWLLEWFGFRTLGFRLFAVLYIVEQSSTGLVSWSFTIATHVLFSKFVHLGRVREILLEEKDAFTLKKRLALLMGSFRDMCDLIENINSDMGILVVTRVVHDFTLVLSQSYMLFWLVRTTPMWQFYGGYGVVLVAGVLWMLQNMTRLLNSTSEAARAVEEVSRGFFLRRNDKKQLYILQAYTCANLILRSQYRVMDDDIQHMASTLV